MAAGFDVALQPLDGRRTERRSEDGQVCVLTQDSQQDLLLAQRLPPLVLHLRDGLAVFEDPPDTGALYERAQVLGVGWLRRQPAECLVPLRHEPGVPVDDGEPVVGTLNHVQRLVALGENRPGGPRVGDVEQWPAFEAGEEANRLRCEPAARWFRGGRASRADHFDL